METPVQHLLQQGAARADEALERLLPGPDTPPHSLHRAMRHSVFAGGKRLRPTLSMEAARLIAGAETSGAADLGAALELLHTYSLIHDDLPALDNDDLRRGHPTCHVLFGEAIAILAGDALQTLAYQILSTLPIPAENTVQIIREISLATGTGVPSAAPENNETIAFTSATEVTHSIDSNNDEKNLPPGMIGGQVLDIESEGHPPTAGLVEAIHRAKTGALITVSLVSGALLADATVDEVAALRRFGQHAGLAFQIVDDILDETQSSAALGKTAGKDTATAKATWPAVFGLQASRTQADALIQDAFAALAPFGPRAEALKSIAQYLVDRTY